MSRGLMVGIIVGLMVGVGGSAASAQEWNVADDFSSTANPNGAWAYGWSTGGDLSLFTLTSDTVCGTPAGDVWYEPLYAWSPNVIHNNSEVVIDCTGVILQPNQVSFHPGPNDEKGVVRWTAPFDGSYEISAVFSGVDATTTDVHILHGTTELFSGAISGFGDTQSHSTIRFVTSGESVDFVVGYGSDGNVEYDSTGLHATITDVSSTIPTVSEWGLIAMTVLILTAGGIVVRRTQRQAA